MKIVSKSPLDDSIGIVNTNLNKKEITGRKKQTRKK
jgi:hypothetical protein